MAKTLRDIAPKPKKQVLGDIDGKFEGVKSSKTAPMNLDALEKMPDSRAFIAKHDVETHADRAGNTKAPYGDMTKEADYKRPSNEKLKDDPYSKNMGVYEAKQDDEDDEEDGEGAGDNENEDEDLDEASCNHTSEGVMCEVHGMKECNMESCDKPMAGRNLMTKGGKKLLLDKKKKMEEAWEVKHADGSVENFNNQRDAYRAHQRSSGSTLGASHGAMGRKAASALGWDEYTKGRSEFKGPLRDEPKKTRKEETVSEGKDSLYHVSWGTGVEHQVTAKHYDDAVSKAKDAIMKKTPKLKDKKYSDTFSKKPTVHNISKEKEAMKWQKHMIGEVVNMKDTGAVVHDFVHSKNPKFAGKSKAERIKMALGASYAAKRTKKEDAADGSAKNNDYAGPGAAGWTTGRMDTGTL